MKTNNLSREYKIDYICFVKLKLQNLYLPS